MADSELAAIRARRLEELQTQYGGQNTAQMQQQQQQQEAMQREAEMRNSLLSQILGQGARARLNSIALVKPEKAKMMESMLIQMARSGQIAGKLSESQLVTLLEDVSKTQKKTTVQFKRKPLDESDDDDD